MSGKVWFVSFVYYTDSNPFPKFGNYSFDSDYPKDAELIKLFNSDMETWGFEHYLEQSGERKDVTVISISKLEKEQSK